MKAFKVDLYDKVSHVKVAYIIIHPAVPYARNNAVDARQGS